MYHLPERGSADAVPEALRGIIPPEIQETPLSPEAIRYEAEQYNLLDLPGMRNMIRNAVGQISTAEHVRVDADDVVQCGSEALDNAGRVDQGRMPLVVTISFEKKTQDEPPRETREHIIGYLVLRVSDTAGWQVDPGRSIPDPADVTTDNSEEDLETWDLESLLNPNQASASNTINEPDEDATPATDGIAIDNLKQSGRGLAIIGGLADGFGWFPTGQGGKTLQMRFAAYQDPQETTRSVTLVA